MVTLGWIEVLILKDVHMFLELFLEGGGLIWKYIPITLVIVVIKSVCLSICLKHFYTFICNTTVTVISFRSNYVLVSMSVELYSIGKNMNKYPCVSISSVSALYSCKKKLYIY